MLYTKKLENKSSKIFDCFIFYNEIELLELRLEYLFNIVDYFIIVEAPFTFSGKNKPLYFIENQKKFKKYSKKIIYYCCDNNFRKYSKKKHKNYTDWNMSVNHKHHGKKTKDLPEIFQREIYQRDSIIEPLKKIAKPNDIIMLSDVDEIPSVESVKKGIKLLKTANIVHFEMKWLLYKFNLCKLKKWYGTRLFLFDYIQNKYSIDFMRFPLENKNALLDNGKILKNSGWHFSFFGDESFIKNKLSALNYHSRRSSLYFKLVDYFYNSRIKKVITSNKDLFYRDELVSLALSKIYTNDFLKIIINKNWLLR